MIVEEEQGGSVVVKSGWYDPELRLLISTRTNNGLIYEWYIIKTPPKHSPPLLLSSSPWLALALASQPLSSINPPLPPRLSKLTLPLSPRSLLPQALQRLGSSQLVTNQVFSSVFQSRIQHSEKTKPCLCLPRSSNGIKALNKVSFHGLGLRCCRLWWNHALPLALTLPSVITSLCKHLADLLNFRWRKLPCLHVFHIRLSAHQTAKTTLPRLPLPLCHPRLILIRLLNSPWLLHLLGTQPPMTS